MAAKKTTVEPFFQVPDSSSVKKRLLLISYHFPPGQAVGALRWEKLARYVADYGYSMDVITVHPTALEAKDDERLKDLPEGTRLYGLVASKTGPDRLEEVLWRIYKSVMSAPVSACEPFKPRAEPADDNFVRIGDITWTRFLKDVPLAMRRLFYLWGDCAEYAAWAKRAAALAQALAGTTRYYAVITSGPPHMAHEAGRMVATSEGIPLIVDLRDPWSLLQRVLRRLASPLWLWVTTRRERKVFGCAALVVVNTEAHRLALGRRYVDFEHKIITVMNGCDDDDLEQQPQDQRFIIAFAGSIYLDRDPRPLFAAVGKMIKKLQLSPNDISIELMGNVMAYAGIPTVHLAEAARIKDYVRLYEARARKEALAFLANASVLVNLPQDSDMAIPAKLFEYMQFDAWLLAIEPSGSAVELLLRESGADIVAPDDIDRMALVLERRYQEFVQGLRPRRLSAKARFTRKEQARLFFDALKSRGIVSFAKTEGLA